MLEGTREFVSQILRLAALITLWVVGCSSPDHYLVHPREPADAVLSWEDEYVRDPLVIHVRVARSEHAGPAPVVIVHPEGGKTADDMQGILWDLAARGYVAIAADYWRRIDGAYRRNVFAWRSDADVTAILDAVRDLPGADPGCVGLLGFSLGGVYSLLIAAHAPERVSAVVAYYPVTDFPRWLSQERSAPRRFAFAAIRWWFRRESGAATDAEYERMLRAASPWYVADAITAPVLLVHGDRDTSAPIEESMRMAERLRALDKPVELLVVPGGRHIFNFRQPEQAAFAWHETVEWLEVHLRSPASRCQRAFHARSIWRRSAG
jgi:dipeptidyl aminopeptidase/acylaminoacyl peptidase